uniref:Spherical body protein 4 SBP4 n=1 Tax=Babesia bovis TaxID=5865 RepID=S6BN43_BABBO|nr:spherical body protein 4 SBP4 [Babesia bovis]
MVAISLRHVLLFAAISYAKVFAEEEETDEYPIEVEEPYDELLEEANVQVHGAPNAMSLNLLMPVNTHRILKTSEFDSAHTPVHYKPLFPFKLVSVSWSESPIFEIPVPEEEQGKEEKTEETETKSEEDGEEAEGADEAAPAILHADLQNKFIDEVVVFRNCFDTAVSVNVDGKQIYFTATGNEAEDFTIDISETDLKSECLVAEDDKVYDLSWYSIHAAPCYLADKVLFKGNPLWEATDKKEHFAGCSVNNDGDDRLIALSIRNGPENRQIYFYGVDGALREIDNDEMVTHYEAFKEKEQAERERYEAEEKARLEAEKDAEKEEEENKEGAEEDEEEEEEVAEEEEITADIEE